MHNTRERRLGNACGKRRTYSQQDIAFRNDRTRLRRFNQETSRVEIDTPPPTTLQINTVHHSSDLMEQFELESSIASRVHNNSVSTLSAPTNDTRPTSLTPNHGNDQGSLDRSVSQNQLPI